MEHVEQDLPELLRSDLSATERSRIESHLQHCPSCRAEWESMSFMADPDLRQRASVPEGYFSTLPARILERRARPRRLAWPSSLIAAARPLLPVVAGALVLYALADLSATEGTNAGRLPVGASEVAAYLTSDPIISTTDLAPVAEGLLTDRSLVMLDPRAGDTGLEDLEPQTTADLVEGLNDEEVDQLILKLSERTL